MSIFFSSARQRAAHYLELLRYKKQRRLIVAHSIQQVDKDPPPAPTAREGGLVDWNDPAQVAAINSGMRGSDIERCRINAATASAKKQRAIIDNRQSYERKCMQDEARIARSTPGAPWFNIADMHGWYGRREQPE